MSLYMTSVVLLFLKSSRSSTCFENNDVQTTQNMAEHGVGPFMKWINFSEIYIQIAKGSMPVLSFVILISVQ